MEFISDILNAINNRDVWFFAIAIISVFGVICVLDHNKYGFNFSEKFVETYFYIYICYSFTLLSSQSSTYLYEEYNLFLNDDISTLEFLAFLIGMF